MKKNLAVHSTAPSVSKITKEKSRVYVRTNITKTEDGFTYDEMVLTYPEYETLAPVFEDVEILEKEVQKKQEYLEDCVIEMAMVLYE